jgi:hypothetical protein
MVSKLSKEGAFRKGLEVYFALTDMQILPDTAITNAAISACDKGNAEILNKQTGRNWQREEGFWIGRRTFGGERGWEDEGEVDEVGELEKRGFLLWETGEGLGYICDMIRDAF